MSEVGDDDSDAIVPSGEVGSPEATKEPEAKGNVQPLKINNQQPTINESIVSVDVGTQDQSPEVSRERPPRRVI